MKIWEQFRKNLRKIGEKIGKSKEEKEKLGKIRRKLGRYLGNLG